MVREADGGVWKICGLILGVVCCVVLPYSFRVCIVMVYVGSRQDCCCRGYKAVLAAWQFEYVTSRYSTHGTNVRIIQFDAYVCPLRMYLPAIRQLFAWSQTLLDNVGEMGGWYIYGSVSVLATVWYFYCTCH